LLNHTVNDRLVFLSCKCEIAHDLKPLFIWRVEVRKGRVIRLRARRQSTLPLVTDKAGVEGGKEGAEERTRVVEIDRAEITEDVQPRQSPVEMAGLHEEEGLDPEFIEHRCGDVILTG